MTATVKIGPLLRRSSETALSRVLPEFPQRYRITIVGNDPADSGVTFARTIDGGSKMEHVRNLGIPYPPEVFSKSHLSIPFPMSDSLYGMRPDTSQENFGIQLGALAPRGERGALIVDMDFLSRVASNPFFPFITELIDEGIRDPRPIPPRPLPGMVYAPRKTQPPTTGELEEYFPDPASTP